MVNVKNLFGMAVMATALVGCSSNDNLAPDGKDNVGKTGEAYASFTINLPTTRATRATDGEPAFAEGDAKEYEVKNGTILIFDMDGKYVTSAQLGNMNPWKDIKTDGVTTAATATVQLSGVTVGGSYQALVLLNNDVDDAPSKVKLPISGESYADWSANAENANATYTNTDYIFMANAPKYTGTSTEPTTLVPVANICASREQAEAQAATTVYVERGLAKVTMQKFNADGYSIAAGTYEGAKVEIKNWQLDVTNKSTFPVHQTGGLMTSWAEIWNTPRFYDQISTAFKRVYWGIDPNYNNSDYQTLVNCKTAFNMITKDKVVGEAGNTHPQYCLENTFDLDNMKQGQTTRVVFKAVFTPKGFTGSETFYKIGNNTAIWDATKLAQQIKTVAVTAMGITDAAEQNKYSVDLSKGSNISGVAGQHLVEAGNIIYSGEAASSKVTEAIVNAINEKLGLSAKTGISTYLNGEAYYIARIKHFNELTHWEAGQAYDTDNAAFLGRYGVLRNNWYDLAVNSISGLGYPDIPEVKPNMPDDENEQFINVEVKILDWAKRSQNIDL